MYNISIIIPTYNRLWSLPKAINSCYDTHLKIQVIIIDDGSTDGTFEWLSTQDGIEKIKQNNQGKDWAVNNALKYVKAKYVRFLDSDDWLLPFSSDLLYEKAKETDADIICAGHEFYVEEKKIKTIDWINYSDFIAQQLGACDSSHYSAYLFKTEFIKDIPHRQEFGALDDRQFIIECALKKPKTAFVEQPTLAHVKHGNDRLQSYRNYLEEITNLNARLKIYEKAFQSLLQNKELNEERLKVICNYTWMYAHWLAKYNIKSAYVYVKWIYKINPSYVIGETKALRLIYNKIGFMKTQKILSIRRKLLGLFKHNDQ